MARGEGMTYLRHQRLAKEGRFEEGMIVKGGKCGCDGCRAHVERFKGRSW